MNDGLSKTLDESCISREETIVEQVSRVMVNIWKYTDGLFKDRPHNPSQFVDPWNHGAAVEEGVWYKWARDRFPRLELSDGQQMPGGEDVPFDQWKHPRPDFVLDQDF